MKSLYCFLILVAVNLVNAQDILVKFKDSTSSAKVNSIIKELNVTETKGVPALGIKGFSVPSILRKNTIIQKLSENTNVLFAEENTANPPEVVPNDPLTTEQWYINKLKLPQAWNFSLNSSNIYVACLDTGLNSHQDINSNVFISMNFYDGSNNYADTYGHGTMTTGTLGAVTNNALGIAGVAWNPKILNLKVSAPNGYAYDSTIANALVWAADNYSPQVATMSYHTSESVTVQWAARYFMERGGIVFASAGNAGQFVQIPDPIEIVACGAIDVNDNRPGWSNYGYFVDFASPGVNIRTTAPNGNYTTSSGTSFSAPIAAGIAALIYNIRPDLTGSNVLDILNRSVVDLGTPGRDIYFGMGRIDTDLAIKNARIFGDDIPPTGYFRPLPSQFFNILRLSVDASDNVGINRVEYYVNGNLWETVTEPIIPGRFHLRFDGISLPPGQYAFQAKIVDLANNETWSNIQYSYKK